MTLVHCVLLNEREGGLWVVKAGEGEMMRLYPLNFFWRGGGEGFPK